MGSLLIRHVDDALRDRLKVNARAHHRSLEEEARELLRGALAMPLHAQGETLTEIARRCFGADGMDIDLPERPRMPERAAVDFADSAYDR